MKKRSAATLAAVFGLFMASSAHAAEAQGLAARTILTRGEDSMKMTIEKMKSALSSFPMRACLDLLEDVRVESRGAMVPLNKLADVSTPSAKVIEIRPRDMTQLTTIEKAILKSDLGLTPANDGNLIRLPLPSLTEARRREVIRTIHRIADSFRNDVRNQRRNMMESISRAEKDKRITEEERREAEEQSQKLTDMFIQKIDELLASKENDVMEV